MALRIAVAWSSLHVRKVSMVAKWCRDQIGVFRAQACGLCLLLQHLYKPCRISGGVGVFSSHPADGGTEAQLRKLLTATQSRVEL